MDTETKATVVDLNSKGSLKVKVILALLEPEEGSDWRFDPACVFEVHNPTVLTTEDDTSDVIGHSNVYTDGKRLLADMFIVRDCPQRLDIESKEKKWYPCPVYELIDTQEEPLVVKRVRVMHIRIQEECQDPRLPAIGEVVL